MDILGIVYCVGFALTFLFLTFYLMDESKEKIDREMFSIYSIMIMFSSVIWPIAIFIIIYYFILKYKKNI